MADSYEAARRPCARYLQKLSFSVSEASNTEEALARILKSPPRLILAEWTLPALLGDRPTQWLAQGVSSDIPVVLIANTEDPSLRLPDVAVAGVLRKPFTLAQMITEIRRVLREKYPFPAGGSRDDLLSSRRLD